jgi:hypothetical protein
MAILKPNKETLPSKIESNLQPWLLPAKNSLIGSFARKIARDLGPAHAAIAALVERPDGRKDNKTTPTAMVATASLGLRRRPALYPTQGEAPEVHTGVKIQNKIYRNVS